jgi:hypothetical protein
MDPYLLLIIDEAIAYTKYMHMSEHKLHAIHEVPLHVVRVMVWCAVNL